MIRPHSSGSAHSYLPLLTRSVCAHWLAYIGTRTGLTTHSLIAATTDMGDRQPRRWTTAEDQILREQVDAQQSQGIGKDWCQVASALPGRTNKDCRKRWHNSVTEGLKKGQWSKSEDQLLTHGMHRYGPQWTKVATCVSTRSADQCAKRWQQSLDPRLDRSDWRENEDAALLVAVERLGRHWKDIQEQFLPHRSKNCVKNRYSVLSRRNASQLVPYDDSVEGSSSDPGTPLQLEVNSSFAYTSPQPAYNFPQRSYGYAQQSFLEYDNESPTWSGLSGSTSFQGAYHSEHYGASSVPTPPSVHPDQVLPSNAAAWINLQPAMGMQTFIQYSASSSSPYQTKQYAPSQPLPTSFGGSYALSYAQAPDYYAPTVGSSKRDPHSRGYDVSLQDISHFNMSSQ